MGTLGTIYAEGLPKATGQRHLPSGKSSGDSPPGDVFQENGSLLNWLQYSVEPLSSLHNCTGRRLLPFLSRERRWIRCVAGELVAAERDAKVGQIGNFQMALAAEREGLLW